MKRMQANFRLIFFLIILCRAYAGRDFDQMVPFQGDLSREKYGFSDDTEEILETSPFIIHANDKNQWEATNLNKESSSPFLFSGRKDLGDDETLNQLSEKEKLNIRGASLPGMFSDSENYQEYTNREIMEDISNQSRNRLTFSFIRDTFDYKNEDENFDKIYRNSDGTNIHGVFILKNDFYYVKGFVNLFYGLGLGLGYNKGRGVFTDEEGGKGDDYTDKVDFTFYTVPVDARFGLEIPLGSYLGLSFSGGPGVLGVVEHRTDRGHESDDRNKFQMGGGYFGSASLNIVVSSISRRTGVKILSRNGVSRFSANLEARYHSYFGFKDDNLAISGASFGIGFSYNFL